MSCLFYVFLLFSKLAKPIKLESGDGSKLNNYEIVDTFYGKPLKNGYNKVVIYSLYVAYRIVRLSG